MVPLLALIGLLLIVGLLAMVGVFSEKKVMRKFQDDTELSEEKRELERRQLKQFATDQLTGDKPLSRPEQDVMRAIVKGLEDVPPIRES